MNKSSQLNIAYFGGEPIGLPILKILEEADILPHLVVCNPDRPVGRKQVCTPPAVKVWAKAHNIKVFQPESLTDAKKLSPLTEKDWDLFIVVAYNKILPLWLIELPKHKTLNVHPSLLPLLRGASPIRSAILQDMRKTGVTIMHMDAKMDHGPIVVQEKVDIPTNEWPIRGKALDTLLAQKGGEVLIKTIPRWIAGEIIPQEQIHKNSTHCRKIEKKDSELILDPNKLPEGDDAYQILLKIRAYDGWPGTFFMYQGKRIKIVDADITEDTLCIYKIIPEGKKETDFTTYFQ